MEGITQGIYYLLTYNTAKLTYHGNWLTFWVNYDKLDGTIQRRR